MSFDEMVFQTGIADFFRYKKKPPVYWRDTFEQYQWQAGWNHAQSCVGGGR